MRLRAIVVRNISDEQIIKRANLLRNDSVHGAFNGVVDIDLKNRVLIINGQTINIIDGSNPSEIDYESYDIKNALLIDNTGAFTSKEALPIENPWNVGTKVNINMRNKYFFIILYF